MCLDCKYGGLGGLYGGRGFGGGLFGYDDGFSRANFAPVSSRAKNALEDAKRIFLQHLPTVDTSRGPVTTEIINFHLVPDMRKAFNKYVKEYGCHGTSRQLTRAEQDLVNKNRKSLLWYTSVTVTPQAQQAYLQKNPHLAPKPAADAQAPVAGSSSSASTSTSVNAPTQDVAGQIAKNKLNEAISAKAATNTTLKKVRGRKNA
ncbi:hypothetical protein BXZ70DRAFT_314621 [Cristinia sonorae]|uniref:Uncharacterized protein n=1 Tax=Cristinia sonorae TaxID=1940300 RepID=A0A8K0XN97_9AGAR|nr:hypothetical protein BXZ70DRAFT_314621 [Cristinia sonorae]